MLINLAFSQECFHYGTAYLQLLYTLKLMNSFKIFYLTQPCEVLQLSIIIILTICEHPRPKQHDRRSVVFSSLRRRTCLTPFTVTYVILTIHSRLALASFHSVILYAYSIGMNQSVNITKLPGALYLKRRVLRSRHR